MLPYLSSFWAQQAAAVVVEEEEGEKECPEEEVVKRGPRKRARIAASTRPVVRPRAVRGLLIYENSRCKKVGCQ